MRQRIQICLIVCAIIFGGASFANASEGKVSISAPWIAEGKIYRVAPGQIHFSGSFSGTMYVDHGNGKMNTAVFVCPGVEKIDTERLTFSVDADCFITAYNGDLIFGSMECDGEDGVCEGVFELTGGTGEFSGMSGSGKIVTRTVFESFIMDLAQGSVINSAAGLASWPELRYEIPEKSSE